MRLPCTRDAWQLTLATRHRGEPPASRRLSSFRLAVSTLERALCRSDFGALLRMPWGLPFWDRVTVLYEYNDCWIFWRLGDCSHPRGRADSLWRQEAA